MRLVSSAFKHEGKIPFNYTCDGKGISPPLEIRQIPSGSKSLVLIMADPDVPRSIRADGMWDHWIVFNISPSTASIAEGEQPRGVAGKGTGGDLFYSGPCPPDREHRYFFKVYALDVLLDLKEGAKKAEVEQAMQGHILSEAALMGKYERRQRR